MMIGFSPRVLMSDTLNISLNEFRALLRKAFEGLFVHGRDWHALADLVIWLECNGQDGLAVFLTRADALSQMPAAKLESRGLGSIELNGQSQSMLLLHHSVCDLAIAEVKSVSVLNMHIKQAADPSIIVASVAHCAEYGLASAAWWPGGEGWAYIATQNCNDSAPYLRRVTLPPSHKALSGITFIAAESTSRIESDYPDWFLFQDGNQHPPNEIQKLFLKHLDGGCEINTSDYDKLVHLSNAVLVEATDASRQGAGPS